MSKLRVLSLFAGIGGFDLGLERTGGFETVAFCEINQDRQADLAECFPGIPIYSDVRELSGADVGPIDLIAAGFPCQDISTAGKKAGIHGERTGLFSEIVRLARDLRPRYLLLENSADLLTGDNGAWARHVFGELAALGYDAEWNVIPASALGAPHPRERLWIVAYTRCTLKRQRFELLLGRRFTRTGEIAAVVADAHCPRELQSGWSFRDQRGRLVYHPEWAWPETWIEKLSQLRGLDDGLPSGLATQTAQRFGNSVVPQIPELIGRAILASLQHERLAA